MAMDVGDIKLVESDCQDWIEAVTGSYFQEDSFRESLQDGVLLCKLLNAVKRGAVNKVNTRPGTFAHMENLNAFIAGCKSLGIPHSALFAPSDIQAPAALKRRQSQLDAQRRADDKRVRNVLVTLYWLNQKAVSGPGYYGPELATEHFSQLMKDPWALPATAAGKVRRPSLPGVSSERLADNEVTGLRRASLAVSPTSERSGSPMDRPRSLLVEESCRETSSVLLSTTSSDGGSSLGTPSTHAFSSPSSSSQSGLSARSSASDSAPTTRRLSTGETLIFSPRQLALQAALELTEDPLDSVPEDRPSPGYHASQSIAGGDRSAKPQGAASQRTYSSTGTVAPRNASSSAAAPRNASSSAAAPRNASGSAATPRNASRETAATDSVPSARKRSDSGVAFLASPVMMTITASIASDSDGSEGPVRVGPATTRTTRDQPKRFTAAPGRTTQPYKSASLPRQPAPATSFYPTPSPDSSKSPSPDFTSPPPSRGPASSQRTNTAASSKSVASQWQRKSPEAPSTGRSVPSQPSKQQQQQQQQQRHVTAAPVAQSQAEQRYSGVSASRAATVPHRDRPAAASVPHRDRPAAATLPRSFGSTSSQAASTFSRVDGGSKGPPPPPPKRDAAAETKRSQIYAALGRPSPPQSVSPATTRSTDQPTTATSTVTNTVTSTVLMTNTVTSTLLMTNTVTSTAEDKDSTQDDDLSCGAIDIRDQIMADLADFTASRESTMTNTVTSTAEDKGSTQDDDQSCGAIDIRDQIMADLADFTGSRVSTPSPSLPSPPLEAMVPISSLESTPPDTEPAAVTLPPAPPAPAVSVRRPSIGKSLSFSAGSDTQRLMAEEQKWRPGRRRSELAKQVDMLLDDNSLVKSLSRPLSASHAGGSHDGSEAFLDAAASDARVQEQQQLKWLQSMSARPTSPPPPLLPAGQRPASAAGYLHDDYLCTADGDRDREREREEREREQERERLQSPTSELSPHRHSPPAVGSPTSPLDLTPGIDEHRSEMERLLALADEERSQQLAAAEEHRRMSLDQQHELTKRRREKALRTLALERRQRSEQQREQRWTRVEEERRRQLREEEDAEARALDGYLARSDDGGGGGGSQEAIADFADGAGDVDDALALEIENEPIWEVPPTRPGPEGAHAADDGVADALAEGDPEARVSQSSELVATAPRISVSHDADRDEANGCVRGSYSADPESSLAKTRTNALSESSIASILDPLASAIESVSLDKTGKRRSITKFQTSSIVVSPLRSPRTSRSRLSSQGVPLGRHASGSSLGRTSPPSRPGSSSSLTGRASPLVRQSSDGSLLGKTSPPAPAPAWRVSDSSPAEESPPYVRTDCIAEEPTLPTDPFIGRPPSEESPPVVSEESLPDVSEESPPDVSEESPPDVSEESPPDVSEESPPDISEESPPDVSEESPLDVKTDSIVEEPALLANPFIGRPLPEEPSPPAKPPRPSGLVETNLPSPNLPASNGFGHSNMSRFFSSATTDFADNAEDQTDNFEATASEFASGGIATDV